MPVHPEAFSYQSPCKRARKPGVLASNGASTFMSKPVDLDISVYSVVGLTKNPSTLPNPGGSRSVTPLNSLF